jgi:hypothetical protein
MLGFSFYLHWILDFSSHSAQFLAFFGGNVRPAGCQLPCRLTTGPLPSPQWKRCGCGRLGRGVEAFHGFAGVSPDGLGRLAGHRWKAMAGVDTARYAHRSVHHTVTTRDHAAMCRIIHHSELQFVSVLRPIVVLLLIGEGETKGRGGAGSLASWGR